MNKKISVFLMLPLVMAAVTSCGNNGRRSANEGSNILTKEIIKANTYQEDWCFERFSYNSFEKKLLDEMYKTANVSSLSVGYNTPFVQFEFADGEYLVYSLFKGDFVLPKMTWTTISQDSTGELLFLERATPDGNILEQHYFDIMGNSVFEWTPGKEYISTIDGYWYDEKNNSNNLRQIFYLKDGKAHVENIYYVGDEIFQRLVDKDIKGKDILVNEGGKIVIDPEKEFDSLEYLGLKGYYMNELNNKRFIYNEEGKVVSSYSVPVDRDIRVELDKYEIYQKSYLVDDHSNYDYIAGGKRYALLTEKLDILTGVIEKIDVDYVINGIEYEILDEKSEYVKYAACAASLIDENKFLALEGGCWVIDVNGVRHNNVTHVRPLYEMSAWGEYLVSMPYNGLSHKFEAYVYNYDLDPVAIFNDVKAMENFEYLVYLDANGCYGIVNNRLEVVVAPQFAEIDGWGEANKFFAEYPNGDFGMFEIKGNSLVINKLFEHDRYDYLRVGNGILYVTDTEAMTEEYVNQITGEKIEVPEVPTGTQVAGALGTSITQQTKISVMVYRLADNTLWLGFSTVARKPLLK